MKPHKPAIIVLTLALLALFAGNIVAAPLGTTFTYQGQLKIGGNPANGSFDLTFTLFDTNSAGSAVAGPLTNAATAVSNGLFTVALDFGSGVFTGDARWLEIAVRPSGSAGDFTILAPRQPVTPTPYALMASGVSGPVPDARLSANIPRLGANQVFTGSNVFANASGPSFAVGSSNQVANLNAQFLNGNTSTNFVAKAGDTMTGRLNLPADGLGVGGNQLVVSGGSVGIGTGQPTAPLEVSSDTNTNPAGSGSILITGASNKERFAIRSSGGDPVFTGNKCSGSLANPLPPNAGARLAALGGSGFDGNAWLYWNPGLIGIFAAENWLTNQLGTYLNFETTSSGTVSRVERMRIADNGNVGIGTTGPATRLHVYGTGGGSVVATVEQPSGMNFVDLKSTQGGGNWGSCLRFIDSGTVNAAIFSAANSQLHLATAGTDRMVIDQTGNVGIGAPVPVAKLHLGGSVPGGAGLGLIVQNLDPTGYGQVSFWNDAGGAAGIFLGGSLCGVGTPNAMTILPNPGSLQLGAANVIRMTIDAASGNVGIGTSTPQAKLDVNGNIDISEGGGWLRLSKASDSGIDFSWGTTIKRIAADGRLQLNAQNGVIELNGNVGIGTNAPQAKLDVNGTVRATAFQGDGSALTGITASGTAGGDLAGTYPNPTIANGAVTGARIADGTIGLTKLNFTPLTSESDLKVGANTLNYVPKWNGTALASGTMFDNGNVGIGTNAPQAKLHVNGNAIVNGTNTVKVLSITGGADVAEPFTMSGAEIPKGSVVVIDDAHAGQLKLSERAYDKRVAGIVSGAGGVNPGLTLSQHEVVEGGQNVALTGRVYALADATNGSIQPGDLLTTSAVPGHAMKVSDSAKAQGAILGKAMSRLESGRGLVLVLVTLQ